MHIKALLQHLTRLCGEPTHIDGQEAYRWELPQAGSTAHIHICLTVEQSTRRASIWVFNPEKPNESQTQYMSVENDADVENALNRIIEACPEIVQKP